MLQTHKNTSQGKKKIELRDSTVLDINDAMPMYHIHIYLCK